MWTQRRVYGARALVVGLLALVVAASGCAPTAKPTTEPRQPAPQWGAAALRSELPGVLLVRGRELAIAKLDSTATVPIWTAPAETTPTILAVDQVGGRIAVLLRSATGAPPRMDASQFPPQWRDAGIVILSADGSAKRFAVTADQRRVHYRQSSDRGPLRSFEGTVSDLVSAGAFAGGDLLLATDRLTAHYPEVGDPLRMTPDGSMTPLTVDGTSTLGPANQFVELPHGGAVVVYGNPEPFNMGGDSVALAELRDSVLTSPTAAYKIAPGENANSIGSANDTVSIAYKDYGPHVGTTLAVASFAGGAWSRRQLPIGPIVYANGAIGFGPGGEISGVPQAGPGEDLLLPMATVAVSGPLRGIEPTSAVLTLSSASFPRGVRRKSVTVEWERDARSRSWAYVERFGR